MNPQLEAPIENPPEFSDNNKHRPRYNNREEGRKHGQGYNRGQKNQRSNNYRKPLEEDFDDELIISENQENIYEKIENEDINGNLEEEQIKESNFEAENYDAENRDDQYEVIRTSNAPKNKSYRGRKKGRGNKNYNARPYNDNYNYNGNEDYGHDEIHEIFDKIAQEKIEENQDIIVKKINQDEVKVKVKKSSLKEMFS